LDGDSRIDRVQVPIRVPDKTREDFFGEDEQSSMTNLRIWIIVSWIALPTVMFGGASLLRLLNRGNVLSPFQVNCFRAGHAHAGVLLVMSLPYYIFLDQTGLSVLVKHVASAALFLGILAQSGGFFVHMWVGRENRASEGTTTTFAGAGLLASSVVVLVYGLLMESGS